MEKVINDFSSSLILWQSILIVLLIAIVNYVFKLYKKIMKK